MSPKERNAPSSFSTPASNSYPATHPRQGQLVVMVGRLRPPPAARLFTGPACRQRRRRRPVPTSIQSGLAPLTPGLPGRPEKARAAAPKRARGEGWAQPGRRQQPHESPQFIHTGGGDADSRGSSVVVVLVSSSAAAAALEGGSRALIFRLPLAADPPRLSLSPSPPPPP